MFFLAPLLLQLVVGVALQTIGYLLTAKPKSEKIEEVTDMDSPTAEGGRPISVVFGELDVNSINVIDFLDKQTTTREIKA